MMIAGLIGSVYQKYANYVLFEVNGVIYEVFMSIHSIARIESKATILITQIVREDGISLYGFLDRGEKGVFDTLIKINGIGPKVAISICSTFVADDFIKIVNNNDFASLKKVQGIGEKMAKRIIVELSGKLESLPTSNLSNAKNEALKGLESLGFKSNDILPLVQNSTSNNSAKIIKEVLQKIKGK